MTVLAEYLKSRLSNVFVISFDETCISAHSTNIVFHISVEERTADIITRLFHSKIKIDQINTNESIDHALTKIFDEINKEIKETEKNLRKLEKSTVMAINTEAG